MDDIKVALKKAKEIVLDPALDIPVELQPVALSEVFKLLISRDYKGLTQTLMPESVQRSLKTNISTDNFYRSLAEKEDLSEDEFKGLFDYSGGQINLIMHPIPGNTRGDQEKNAALLILFAYKMGLSQEWLSATKLRKALQNLGLGGTNFSTNIRAMKPNILPEVQNGENGYKVTIPGELTAINILKEFTKGKTNGQR